VFFNVQNGQGKLQAVKTSFLRPSMDLCLFKQKNDLFNGLCPMKWKRKLTKLPSSQGLTDPAVMLYGRFPHKGVPEPQENA
jgi:hypothetical protein